MLPLLGENYQKRCVELVLSKIRYRELERRAMQKVYVMVGGGILLAVIAGAMIASMQRGTAPVTTTPLPSPSTNAASPTTAGSSPDTALAPTTSPVSPSLGKPSPTAVSPATTAGTTTTGISPTPTTLNSPVAIAPQTTGASNPIRLTSCKITMARVLDPDPPLNLRSSPEVKPDNIVGKLDNGIFLQVMTEKGGWFQVTTTGSSASDSGDLGWVSKKQTEYSCNQKVAVVALQPGGSPVTISDRFIGTGSHMYQVMMHKGQTLVLTAKSDPSPYVMDTTGKVIAGNEKEGIDGTWSGSLPADGQYTIALESSFRGYPYSFSLQLK